MKRPSLLTRFRIASEVFRHGYPERSFKAAAPYSWSTYQKEKPLWHLIDYATYCTEGYASNAVVYAAISYKMRALMTAPLRAYRGDPDYPEVLPDTHRLSKLVSRPNHFQSGIEFQNLNLVYLNISGNCYILKDREKKQLLPLRPDRTYIIPDKGKMPAGIIGYLYVPEGKTMEQGVPILEEDIIHIKLPNPYDPFEGMGYGFSPMSAGARSTDVDNMVTKFLKRFFDRGTMLAGLLKFDVPLDDESFNLVAKRWMKQYGGWTNWDKPGILDRGGDYKRLGMTFDEMGFAELDGRNESRMLAPFGVPPILIGTKLGLDRSTYCLPWYTKISTPRGPVNIKDVQVGEKVWSYVDGHLELRKVSWSGKVGRKLTYEIKTKNSTLRATGNHPVLVLEKGSNTRPLRDRAPFVAWKRVDELRVKDKVISPRAYQDLAGDTFPDGSKASCKFMQFAGAFLGDGSTYRCTVSMAIPPGSAVHDTYVQLAKELFTKQRGANESLREPVHIRVSSKNYSFGFASQQTVDLLTTFGFTGTAHTKRIPGWVFGLNRELRFALLAGIVDSDGHIDKHGYFQLGLCNEELVHDIKYLLKSLGIESSNVSYKLHDGYGGSCGDISGDLLETFSFTAAPAAAVAEIPFNNPVHRARSDTSIHSLRFAAYAARCRKAGLSDQLGAYGIKSIEPQIDEDVYDLTVEGSHSFVADGIVVHNSNYGEARTAVWEDTLIPELRLFEVEYQHHLGTGGAFVKFDTSQVPALQKDLPPLIEAALKLFQMGVPANQALRAVGLHIGHVPGGDTPHVALQMQGAAQPQKVQGTQGDPKDPPRNREAEKALLTAFCEQSSLTFSDEGVLNG